MKPYSKILQIIPAPADLYSKHAIGIAGGEYSRIYCFALVDDMLEDGTPYREVRAMRANNCGLDSLEFAGRPDFVGFAYLRPDLKNFVDVGDGVD